MESRIYTPYDPQSSHDLVASWFLGPRAENYVFFKECFESILKRQTDARRAYFPNDQDFITPEMQASLAFGNSLEKLKQKLEDLAEKLSQHSVPFWSPRYNAHMNMDTSMPANLAYITTMLFNPNNVANEASPYTTQIESDVGQQLSAMLGYRPNNDNLRIDEPKAWGHITCDGSVANLESMWAARNLKFYPLSLALAMKSGEAFDFLAPTLEVPLCTGEKKLFNDLELWELLNLQPSTVLDLPTRLTNEYGITADYIANALTPFLIQSIGKDALEKRFGIDKPSQYFVGTTKHYSWPKAAAVTGIGSLNIINVPVDNAARMDTKALEERLEQRLNDKQAVYAVVAIMGSTEQGAIDPLSEVLEIRKKFEARGLSFVVHADAAWGGYFASMLRERRRLRAPRDGRGFVPQLPLPRYTEKELLSLKDADSVTIDPHKSGYIPYPAGGLCYKDERMKYLVTWKSPIVYRDDQPFSMGVYGIEGSKPGAAPVAAYLSHEVLGLHREGYGALLGEAIFSCTKMYCHWATMSTRDIIVTPFNLLPAEKEGCPDPKKIEKQKQFIRERILNRPNIELVGDEEAWKLVKELGSDLCINAFACNFRIKDKVNEDIVEANYFNTRLFERLSITQIKDDMQSRPLILTSSVFTQDDYQGCLTHFKNRLGLVGQQDLYALVNVIMSPFPTEGNFSGQLAEEFRKIAEEEVKACYKRNEKTADLHGFVVQGMDKLHFVHLPMFDMENHRRQLILTGDLPTDIMIKYIEARKTDPSQIFLLGNAEKATLDQLLADRRFKAVLDKGMPSKNQPHWLDNFEITNIRVIRNLPLNSRYLMPKYPAQMPFYLYGSAAQLHIDHALVASPSIQLCADQVQLEVTSGNVDIGILERGAIILCQTVPERALQPFDTDTEKLVSETSFFFKAGQKLPITIHSDPNPDSVLNVSTLGEPFARGTIILGENLWVDSKMINADPNDVHDEDKKEQDAHSHSRFMVPSDVTKPVGQYYKRIAVQKEWQQVLHPN